MLAPEASVVRERLPGSSELQGRRWQDKDGEMRMCRRTQKKYDKGRCSRRDAAGDRDRFMRKMFLKQKWLQPQKVVGEFLSPRCRDTNAGQRVSRHLNDETITIFFLLLLLFFLHQQWIQKEVTLTLPNL